MADWYFVKNGQRQGPVSDGQVRQAVQTGTVAWADLVWRDGMGEWLPAGRVAEVWTGGVAPPPPPVGYGMPAGQYAAPSIGQDAGMRLLLPVGRSVWAIVAGYLGLFSFVVIPAPLALIISVVALWDIRTHPDRHGMGRAIFGLVMGILGTAALAIAVVVNLSRH